MQEFVETLAVLGRGERERMMEWYAGMMPGAWRRSVAGEVDG